MSSLVMDSGYLRFPQVLSVSLIFVQRSLGGRCVNGRGRQGRMMRKIALSTVSNSTSDIVPISPLIRFSENVLTWSAKIHD